jgi:hypothetical protein
MDALSIAEGLSEGLEKGTNNYFNAMTAVKNTKLQAQKNDIEFKKANLDIKKMELEMDPDIVAQNKELLQSKVKAQKSLDQLNIIKAKREAGKVKQEFIQSKMAMDFFHTVVKDPEMRSRLGVSSDGKMTYAPAKTSTVDYRYSGTRGTAPAAKTAVVPNADIMAKARETLKQGGYDDSEASVNLFLKQNPNFA